MSARLAVTAAQRAGYLATSVLLLPAVTASALAGRSRWDTAILATACVAVAVVALRLRTTWEPA